MAGHRHDHATGGDLLGRRQAREQDRLADRVAQRRHPEVVLELGERLGKRLGDRSWAVHGADRDAADLGGHRSGLQQPEVAVGPDRPLHVLWTSEDVRHLPRQGDQAAPQRRRELGSVPARELDDLGLPVEEVPGALDLSADEGFGAAIDRRHRPPIRATGHGVDAEQHAAMPRLDQRLDQDRDRGAGHAGALPRVEDGLHGISEGGEPRHADDRVELPRHRGARRVLQHRRAARDQGLLVATGELEGASQRRVLPPLRRIGIDGRRERRREHHARQRADARHGRHGQRRRLAPGEADVGRAFVAEGHELGAQTPIVGVVVVPQSLRFCMAHSSYLARWRRRSVQMGQGVSLEAASRSNRQRRRQVGPVGVSTSSMPSAASSSRIRSEVAKSLASRAA